MLLICLPSILLHNLTVLLLSTEIRVLPSGLKLIWLISFSCPLRVAISLPSLFQSLMVLSFSNEAVQSNTGLYISVKSFRCQNISVNGIVLVSGLFRSQNFIVLLSSLIVSNGFISLSKYLMRSPFWLKSLTVVFGLAAASILPSLFKFTWVILSETLIKGGFGDVPSKFQNFTKFPWIDISKLSGFSPTILPLSRSFSLVLKLSLFRFLSVIILLLSRITATFSSFWFKINFDLSS